ncbi:MAG: hypothetical protein GY861_07170 [bacterium]|nr:hypothetical protein [bacterium]
MIINKYPLDGDVKRAFSKVKKDTTELKRAINRNFFGIEDLKKKASDAATKEEFYSFIKNLSNKLERMESALVDEREFSQFSKNVDKSMDSLKKDVQQKEDLSEEVRSIRKLKGKLLDLEGKLVERKKFNKEMEYIEKEFGEIKRKLSKEETLKTHIADYNVLKEDVQGFEKKFVGWNDYYKNNKKLEEEVYSKLDEIDPIKEDAAELKKKLVKLDDLNKQIGKSKRAIEVIEQSVADVSAAALTKKQNEKKFRELSLEISKIRVSVSELEDSEVDLDEFITKSKLKAEFIKQNERNKKEIDELGKKIGDLKELTASKDAERIAKHTLKEIETLKKDNEQLSKKTDSTKDLDKLSDDIRKLKEESKNGADQSEIKKLKGDINYITSNIVTNSELDQQINTLHGEIDELKKELKKRDGIHDRVDDMEDKVSKVMLFKKELKTTEEKPKKEEKKRAPPIFPRYLLILIIVAAIILALFFYFENAEDGTDITPEDDVEGDTAPVEEPPDDDEASEGINISDEGFIPIEEYIEEKNITIEDPIISDDVILNITVDEPAPLDAGEGVSEEPAPISEVADDAAPIDGEVAAVPGETDDTGEASADDEGDIAPAADDTAETTGDTDDDAPEEISEETTGDDTTDGDAEAPDETTADDTAEGDTEAPDETDDAVPEEISEEPKELSVEEKTNNCIADFECQQDKTGYFWFGCAYDELTDDCRCYLGAYENCREDLVAEVTKEKQSFSEWLADNKYFVAVVLILLAVLVYFYMTRGDNKKKKKAKPAKEASKDEKINLGEFFEDDEKKENKSSKKKKKGFGHSLKKLFVE